MHVGHQPTVQIHGKYAAMPSGGMIHVGIFGEEAEATLDSGSFSGGVPVTVPSATGHYVARVQALGGSAATRAAVKTIAEVEVEVVTE